MFESWHSIIYLLQIKEAMYEVVNKILIEIQINCNNLQGKLTKQLQPPIECAGVLGVSLKCNTIQIQQRCVYLNVKHINSNITISIQDKCS